MMIIEVFNFDKIKHKKKLRLKNINHQKKKKKFMGIL